MLLTLKFGAGGKDLKGVGGGAEKDAAIFSRKGEI